MQSLTDSARRVVGARQVLRAIKANTLAQAFVARDADPLVTRPIVDACEKGGLHYTEVETMAQLGALCGIGVKASVAGILKAES